MELWDKIKGKNVFMLNEEQKDFEHEQTLISVKATTRIYQLNDELSERHKLFLVLKYL